jgi:hypothetical protein
VHDHGSVIGISVVEYGLGVQAWLGAGPYDPGRVEEVAWPTQPIEKPQHGFFTSSWDDERKTSAWIDWQATQPVRAAEKRTVHLLVPHPNAVLYVIDSPDDYDRLVDGYPQHRSDLPDHPQVCPNWERLAQEGHFDAIHMTAAAVLDKDRWYAHRWEVESTLWFHPKLTVVDRT